MPKIPGVNHLDAVRALEKAGFRIARRGKHIAMTDGVRIITIPRHNPVNALDFRALPVTVLASAAFEMDAAFAWYEQRQAGLGRDFLDAERVVVIDIVHVRQSPDVWPFAS